MNRKALALCAVLFASAFAAMASDPVTYKEIAMLLRNGETQQFIIQDTSRRKLLLPLSTEEEKNLVSLGATPAFLSALREPAMLASSQAAADYKARMQQREATAQQEQLRAAQAAAQAVAKSKQQPLHVKPAAGEIVGKPLDLKFTAADGSPVDLANLRGKVVLIDFWATWCHPCMGEVPNVVAAYKKYHDKGFEIIGISLDKSKETMLDVTREKEMTWPQYFDGKVWNNEITSAYHIHEIPTMWLVNKSGVVATAGARGRLDAEIEKLLAE